jgi:hypothetical protein
VRFKLVSCRLLECYLLVLVNYKLNNACVFVRLLYAEAFNCCPSKPFYPVYALLDSLLCGLYSSYFLYYYFSYSANINY